jgi:hypothetical protein
MSVLVHRVRRSSASVVFVFAAFSTALLAGNSAAGSFAAGSFAAGSFTTGTSATALAALHAGDGAASKPSASAGTVEASFKAGKAPAGLPPETLAAAKRIERWSDAYDYQLTACAGGRVVLVSTLSGKALQGRVQRIERLHAAFEALLPEPQRAAAKAGEVEADWGSLHRPEQGALLLIEAGDHEDYEQLVDELKLEAKGNGDLVYLVNWFENHRDQPGFVSNETLTSAWQVAPPGIEEETVWRAENEMANRLAQLLLYRRYGELPHWLRMALSWHFEQGATGTIHCFPGRTGFVAVDGDHGGWKDALKNEFKDRKKSPLSFSEFADWKRGSWDEARAAYAWGLVEYLATKEPQELGAYLEALRLHRVENAIVRHADGSWQLKPGYEIPQAEQAQLYEARFGKDGLAKASVFLGEWKGWKAPATPSQSK